MSITEVYKYGDKHPNILLAEQKLYKLGYLESKSEVDDYFNEETYKALWYFQANIGVDRLGHPLTLDGELGPLTWDRLLPELTKPPITVDDIDSKFRKELVKVAKSFVGVREVGKANHGPMVKKFLSIVGLDESSPWCMAFVEYCVAITCKNLGITINWVPRSRDLSLKLLKTGHVQTFGNWGKEQGWSLPPVKALPGDIIIIRNKNGTGHTGIVENNQGGYLSNIEGNTNTAGSREGDGVYDDKVRPYSQISEVIRLDIAA